MENIAFEPLQFPCGVKMKNRFMLAPMTNTQSFDDGTLSDDEYHWLTMRAKGGFGLTMTCASHVQQIGQGFDGQLGIFSDDQIKGHKKLSTGIKSHSSVAVVQLHHAGMRSPEQLIGTKPICPSDNADHNSRGISIKEVKQLRDDFISAALRAKISGYDGVEIHGAHGYILTQFLSAEINKRTDEYGGELINRSRLLFEIVDGVRKTCGSDFLIGVRLSPERFGIKLDESIIIAKRLIEEDKIDFLDISLWDVYKLPEEDEHKNRSLLEHFTNLDRGNIKLTVAGKIFSGNDVKKVLDAEVDFVAIGRAGILHHDFPKQVRNDPNFQPTKTPVSKDYLRKEGLGEKFIDYMTRWNGFVTD